MNLIVIRYSNIFEHLNIRYTLIYSRWLLGQDSVKNAGKLTFKVRGCAGYVAGCTCSVVGMAGSNEAKLELGLGLG